jgi:hypothetical protein
MFARPRVVRRRPLLRAAAVGGTYAAGRSMGRRAAEQESAAAYQDQRVSALEEQQMRAPASPPQDAGGETSALDQLSRLAALHQQGELTDEEFAAAKAKLLAT